MEDAIGRGLLARLHGLECWTREKDEGVRPRSFNTEANQTSLNGSDFARPGLLRQDTWLGLLKEGLRARGTTRLRASYDAENEEKGRPSHAETVPYDFTRTTLAPAKEPDQALPLP